MNRRTAKRKMANALKKYEKVMLAGLRGQLNYHGCGEYSFDIFASNTKENLAKVVGRVNAQNTLTIENLLKGEGR